ncbi:MAG: tetratricopeptide repeat protein, partial [Pseudomonadota bacterium]|nr:tetratricopeptide repeat protein [Pseudomonadota bacterium]
YGKATGIFKTITTRYPNSNFAGESFFALGDYYFERSDFNQAIANYKYASKYKRSKRYGWSLFKLGWSYYNIGEFKRSLQTWRKAVQFSKQAQNKNNIRLREEVLQDMIYAFAELDMLNQAITYFRIHGSKQNITSTLETFAQVFISQGKFESAIRAYRRLLSTDPYYDNAPEINKEIVGLYNELGKKETMWKELGLMPTRYSQSSAWARRNANDRTLVADAQKMVKERILYYAKLAHVSAQKKKGDPMPLLKEAERGYKTFLRHYGDAQESLEIKYLLADALFLQKEYIAAANVYMRIVKTDPALAVITYKNNKKENIHAKAAKYMLEARFLDFKPEFQKIIKLKPDSKKSPRPLSVKAKGFINACNVYLRLYPKDSAKRKECDVHVTEIYYRMNHTKEARVRMLMMAKRYHKQPEGIKAVENIIPLYSSDKMAMSTVLKQLLAIPSYKQGKIGAKLRKLHLGIKVDNIEAIKGDAPKAKRFEDLVNKNPNIENADRLLYNAAAGYVNAGDFRSAIRAYSNLVKRYPKSKLAVEAVLRLAKIYDKKLQYRLAARYYFDYAARTPNKDAVYRSSLTRSCELKIFSNDSDMYSVCLRLLQIDKNNYKIVMQRLIETLWLERNFSSLQTLILGSYLNKVPLSLNETIAAYYYLYRAAAAQGKAGGAYANRVTATFGQNPNAVGGEALKYVGEIEFAKVDGALNKFLSIKLSGGNVNAMLRSMQVKSAELNKLEALYGRVLKTKDSYWGVAAFHQMAVANIHYAQNLLNPPQIKGAKIADVKKQLAPQASILHNKAKKFLANAQNTIRRYQIASPWVAKVNSQIGLLSARKRSFREWIDLPDFIGYEVSKLARAN